MNTNSKMFQWLNLDNYKDAEYFSAKKWAMELGERLIRFQILFNPDAEFQSHEGKIRFQNLALEFFSKIKHFGLASNFLNSEMSVHPALEGFDEIFHSFGGVKTTGSSVENISVETAYHSICSRYVEIKADCDECDDLFPFKNIERRAQLQAKNSLPLASLDEDFLESSQFIEIKLEATDDQIKRDFAIWLKDAREKSSSATPSRMYSSADFLDWHKAKVLPYFDLQAIARIENLSPPLHVIGNTLFPDELDVDVAERVRKVTKKKANRLFSHDVIQALEMQGERNY